MGVSRFFPWRAFTALGIAASVAIAAPGVPASAAEVAAPVQTLSTVSEDDYVILRLEMRRWILAEDVEGYRLPGGGLCLDLEQTVAALDFPIAVSPDEQSASGWARSEAHRFELEPGRVRYGDQSERLEGAELFAHAGGLCANVDSIAAWFDLTLEPNLPAALVTVTSETPLPFEAEVERERRRAMLAARAERIDLDRYEAIVEPYRIWRTPSVEISLELEGERNSDKDMRGAFTYGALAAGEAAFLSYDMRVAGGQDLIPEIIRLRAYRSDAEGRLFGSLGVTEAVAGDVTLQARGLTTPAAVGRGAFISNAPLYRSANFDTTDFFGELPVGWDAELYRNGSLIAVSEPTSAGRYEFRDVPLTFQENRFEIVLYGPQGQIRRETVYRNVARDAVPAGQTWVRAAILEDARSLIDLRDEPEEPGRWIASASVEQGLSKRLSGGLHLTHAEQIDADPDTMIEASVRALLDNGVVEIDAAGDLSGGYAVSASAAAQTGSLSLFATTLFRDSLRLRNGSETDERSRIELRAIREFDMGGRPAALSGGVVYRNRIDAPDPLRVDGRFTTSVIGLNVATEVSWQSDSDSGGNEGLRGRTIVGGRMGPVLLRGEAEYGLSGGPDVEKLRATADYRLSRNGMIRGEARYNLKNDSGQLSLGYAQRFDRFAVGGSVRADTGGEVSGLLNVTVAVGPDTRGRFGHVTSEKLASHGQVAARVFTDSNMDGAWQSDEPVHEGVKLKRNNFSAGETGPDGAAILTGFPSGQRARVEIAGGSLPDPFLLPAAKPTVVKARRGITTRVDIPLTPTGEIEGVLFMGQRALPGAALVLKDDGGAIVARTRSEYDGFFLFETVRYGRYRVELADTSLAATGAAPLSRAVEISAANDIANLGAVTLAPPLRIAAAEPPPPGSNPHPDPMSGRD
ncbi:MAG: hypothetical protein V2J26_01795 [Pacificimonas sp.]|jgi:hypothetical protein|nr:hypothetical protein [Pacificimonas sp.]